MRRLSIAIVVVAPIIREGVAAIIGHNPNLRIVGAVDSIAELQVLMRSAEVDVVVVDVALQRDIEAEAELQTLPIVGLQSSLIAPALQRRFSHLATIYTPEEEMHRILIEAADLPAEHNFAESHELSERERDVLVLVATGLTNKEIASKLNISPHTVISHRKNIVHKTGIRSVAGLTVYAVLNKFIDSEKLQ